MKKINKITSLALMAFFLTVLSISAQEINITSAGNAGYMIYQGTFQNDCHNIKFSLKEDCYAVLYAVDNQTGDKTMLVDGEISAGEHGVLFKIGNDKRKYSCMMEIYDPTGNVIHTSNIFLK